MKIIMRTLAALPGLALFLFSQQTLAATGDDAAVEARGSLEEVVVIARKREEPLQETPVAVSVITSDQIDLTFSPNLAAMPFPAPNVNINNGLLSNVLYLSVRGYALTDVDSTLDPPVAVMVDGIYYTRPVMNNLDMFDVEQLEVLRGP